MLFRSSSLQSSPWGLMLALEQQLGELRVDTDDVHYEGSQGDAGDSRPSSGTHKPLGSNRFLTFTVNCSSQ